MRINSLLLNNFRNYTDERVEFSPLTNIIYGNNAQGKTNLLEAVYMFTQGRSYRTSSDRELIMFGSEFASVKSDFSSLSRDFSAVIRISRDAKKKITVNNVSVSKLSMLMSYFNAVIFSPEDLELVKGSPGRRRRFIDGAISQLYPNYLAALIDYYKILKQKNMLLKDLKIKHIHSDTVLSVWNSQLAEKGTVIRRYRSEFFEGISPFVTEIHGNISGEDMKIEYRPNCDGDILERLENNQSREIENGAALYGIHRDDAEFMINGRSAGIYASQGQQRTAVLSLKLAQTEYIENLKDEYPVLLLDDIMSELDTSRRAYLSGSIGNKQVLITCTDADLVKVESDTRILSVDNGRVTVEK
ncbi:MAG: DNA replication/repair protein RecF [Oscillospiraceae bacterium]|nr:DNA replication/repair protein RecF [Oscillospiraceae bacterium]